MRVAVVGGGIGGLTAARTLLDTCPDACVVLFERKPHVGGKIRTLHHDGLLIELGPDGFLRRKPGAVELAREVGLTDQMISRTEENRKTYVKRNGRLYVLPSRLRAFIPTDRAELELSGLISPAGIERAFGGTACGEGDKAAPEETIESFFTRLVGPELYDYIAGPLAAGVFAGDGSALSISATFPELIDAALDAARSAADHGGRPPASTTPTEPANKAARPAEPDAFASFERGMQTIVTALTAELERHTARLELKIDTEIESVTFPDSRVRGSARPVFRVGARNVAAAGREPDVGRGNDADFDAVVLAVPAYVGARLLQTAVPAAAEVLRSFTYASTAIATLVYRAEAFPRPVDAYGYLVPAAETRGVRLPVIACTFSARKWPGRAPEGIEIVRLFIGRADAAGTTGTEGSTVRDADDEQILQVAVAHVAQTLGTTSAPEWSHVHRLPDAILQPTVGHRERCDRLAAAFRSIPGLGPAFVGLNGPGLPDTISAAQRVTRDVARYLKGDWDG